MPLAAKNNENYGENSIKPDVSDDITKKLKETFIENLKRSDEERRNI